MPFWGLTLTQPSRLILLQEYGASAVPVIGVAFAMLLQPV